jgi:peptidoglycan LD-endopeptidase LytH
MRGISRRSHGGWQLPLVIGFCLGVLVHWALRTYGPPRPVSAVVGGDTAIVPARTDDNRPGSPGAARVSGAADANSDASGSGLQSRSVATSGTSEAVPPTRSPSTRTPDELQGPIDGVSVDSFKGGFAERRSTHEHQAVDIPAPRNTPVHAVDDGTIAKLFVSHDGGNTIYQFDSQERLCFYYAHLQRYAIALHEGDWVVKGQVIGYVGTSGNAPPETPHLHFAVFELTPAHEWWTGRALDPYDVFTSRK